MHKKGITEEVAKKRTRRAVKSQRAIVGVSLEKIQAKRNQKPEERMQEREQAVEKAKEQKKAEQAKKRAERTKVSAASGAQKIVKNVAKARPAAKGGKRWS